MSYTSFPHHSGLDELEAGRRFHRIGDEDAWLETASFDVPTTGTHWNGCVNCCSVKKWKGCLSRDDEPTPTSVPVRHPLSAHARRTPRRKPHRLHLSLSAVSGTGSVSGSASASDRNSRAGRSSCSRFRAPCGLLLRHGSQGRNPVAGVARSRSAWGRDGRRRTNRAVGAVWANRGHAAKSPSVLTKRSRSTAWRRTNEQSVGDQALHSKASGEFYGVASCPLRHAKWSRAAFNRGAAKSTNVRIVRGATSRAWE